jgi:hypothetical protein
VADEGACFLFPCNESSFICFKKILKNKKILEVLTKAPMESQNNHQVKFQRTVNITAL